MKLPSLKPCPFCGSAATFDTDPGSHGYYSESVKVKCTKCWVETPSEDTEAWAQGLGSYTVEAQAYGMVAEEWNKRNEQ